MNIQCQICNVIIETEYKSVLIKKFINHLKIHNISYEEYVLKFNYNRIHPLCECGCGQKTKFYKGKFLKYYSNHKNVVKGKYSHKGKPINLSDISKRLTTLNLSETDLKIQYENFITYKKNLSDISNEIGLDKRTIKTYWNLLGYICNQTDFKRIIKKHQYIWTNKNNKQGGKKLISKEILLDIYIFLQTNKNKFTLNEIIKKFDLPYSSIVVYNRLIEEYPKKEINEYLCSGLSSKMELEMYNILKFFFKNDIKRQFRLNNKFYDYILKDKILIEFDGKYWHNLPNRKQSDKIKDDIALNNGYIIFRIKEDERNNIQILNKLKKIYDEN